MYIHWFRRDLRLHDNPALLEALRAGQGHVVPLFILDDVVLRAPRTGAARTAFMLDSLAALDRALHERGSRLVLRRGPPLDVLRDVAEESGARGVCWNRDYTPFARERDARAEALLRARGLDVRTFADAVIIEPGEVLTGAGTPYTVYTPYRRSWRRRVEERRATIMSEQTLPAFAPPPDELRGDPVPAPADLGITLAQSLPPGGEEAGLARLRSFARERIGGYEHDRDLPAVPGTSRLSPYLRFGCVAPAAALRTALHALDALTPEGSGNEESDRPSQPTTHDSQRKTQDSVETWISELAWRDFYYQILTAFPHVLRSAFRPKYDSVQWENDESLFSAWCEGRTGYPIVDAAMRQMRQEAWMHNRARMIVASFLCKDLLVDWRRGERYFMQMLVDGDHASNNGGWQWAAGTGTDAQPYFRIFNPVSQGQKFDPRGEYVRRYIPELARVPDRHIHAPWAMSSEEQRRAGVRIGRDYPEPVVDHATQRERALALYRGATGS
ncbi:MAG: hypothetical protein RLZZ387_404 [Chloroflexota bacterium]|jgi:deoxyribodipyrimidine photo-lyase